MVFSEIVTRRITGDPVPNGLSSLSTLSAGLPGSTGGKVGGARESQCARNNETAKAGEGSDRA